MTTPGATTINWAKLAHDLRGPLMPLQTAAWLMRNQPGESNPLELAEIIERQTQRLARLIDELSEWGRISGMRDPLHVMPVDVSYLVDMAIATIPHCHVQPAYTDDAIRFPLEGDEHQLGKMLHTILEHAVHRDPAGQPRVSVCVDASALHIRASDDGSGLDAAAREALFRQPLEKPSDNGLGLRLLIARQIAEAHGGSLSAESTTEGLSVLCTLPQRLA